ncbi:hypothetical protein PybrP1_000939 [[Pythium] brassicae (nom. inval.)]|nr:hypothetical protein PybrP1_000939 [[Pythium] brassicae (nom. inval.)]
MMTTTPTTTQLARKATFHTLQRLPSARRSSFMSELRDQLQLQCDGEAERERVKEVAAIHRILEKPPEARESQDIDTLYEFVLQNGSTHQIFQGAQEIICKTICREMTLLELPAKGVVCCQGDYGDTFFVIIEGSVSLFIDSKKKLTLQSEESGVHGKGSDRYLHSTPTPRAGERVDSEGNPLPANYGAFIKQIGSGGTFGELAVMDPTARRSCTITCDSPTSFICLKRGAYQRLIRITNSSHLDFTQVEYLETLFFFSQWPHGELTRLSNRLRHLNFAADTFLTRVGSEASVVFFIYAGVVQESVPLVHSLTSNGTVHKVARLESNSSKRSTQEAGAKHPKQQSQPQTKRIALELNVYQDHDVCGEFPVLFNRPLCNTDLLAVTDVKALIMDRETWKELFFMHGLEHIRDAYHKFRAVAESRENWRQTRTKLALCNPGLVLTISTKAMMQDGKCICGWCGSKEHITGDPSCAVMATSKKKQADKQKNGKKKAKRALEMGAKAQAVKNTLAFVHSVAEAQQQAQHASDGATALVARRPPAGSGRRMSLQIAAKQIISDFTPTTPTIATTDFKGLESASNKLYACELQRLAHPDAPPAAAAKLEEVRKSAFPEQVASQYRETLVRRVKRLSTMQDYVAARCEVLETMRGLETTPADERMRTFEHAQPRKPRIPKPARRLCTNGKPPRPDRFNRKINRLLRRLRLKEHPLPVMEESLKDV